MTDGVDAPKRQGHRSAVVLICTLLTILALIVSTLVWTDNVRGFRDAGAFAELLSAAFGMISVIWLAGAVLLQREELALQRQELSLQRQEIKRLADATEEQRETASAQAELDRKNTTTTNVRNTLISMAENLTSFVEESVWECARLNFPQETEGTKYFAGDIKTNSICIEYINETGAKKKTSDISYQKFNEYLIKKSGLFSFHALVKSAQSCEAAGLLDWFKHDLCFYLDPISNCGRADAYCILNAAAHYSSE